MEPYRRQWCGAAGIWLPFGLGCRISSGKSSVSGSAGKRRGKSMEAVWPEMRREAELDRPTLLLSLKKSRSKAREEGGDGFNEGAKKVKGSPAAH